MINFEKYAEFYDLLNREKDYKSEAEYVGLKLKSLNPECRTVLELGSGTGRHGRLLAEMGFNVHGIERSRDMVAESNKTLFHGPGSFASEVGDICKIRLDRTFDAVISLFHVISYQYTNDLLLKAFTTASKHLAPNGIFFFDVWHGPAVLIQQPSERVREASDHLRRIKRTALPILNTNDSQVRVRFDFECTELVSCETFTFSEEHRMRYLFPTEVDLLARLCGLHVVEAKAFPDDGNPSDSTWSVSYVMRLS